MSSSKEQEEDEVTQLERRREVYGIASPDEVKEYAKDPSAVWLDVRSEEEILNPKLGFVSTDKQWMHATCNDSDCPLLNVAAENMIKDKVRRNCTIHSFFVLIAAWTVAYITCWPNRCFLPYTNLPAFSSLSCPIRRYRTPRFSSTAPLDVARPWRKTFCPGKGTRTLGMPGA